VTKRFVVIDDATGLITATTAGAPIPVTAQTASYTLVLADAGTFITFNVAGAHNLTVPLNSSVAFPIGSWIDFQQIGAGQTTVVATGGVTITSTPSTALKLSSQYSAARLFKRAADIWSLIGDISL
jgi:hypothetical protein